MTYPTHEDRTRPADLPRGTLGYEAPELRTEVPSGRSLLVTLGAVAVFVAVIVFFSWTGMDSTTTNSVNPPPTPMEQTQPAPTNPAPVAPAE